MIVGCYNLVLYCDHGVSQNQKGDCWNTKTWGWEYPERNLSRSKKEARRDGWIFHRNDTVSCPACAHKGIPKG